MNKSKRHGNKKRHVGSHFCAIGGNGANWRDVKILLISLWFDAGCRETGWWEDGVSARGPCSGEKISRGFLMSVGHLISPNCVHTECAKIGSQLRSISECVSLLLHCIGRLHLYIITMSLFIHPFTFTFFFKANFRANPAVSQNLSFLFCSLQLISEVFVTALYFWHSKFLHCCVKVMEEDVFLNLFLTVAPFNSYFYCQLLSQSHPRTLTPTPHESGIWIVNCFLNIHVYI